MLLVPAFVAPSTHHGLGLFAAQPITTGSVLWVFRPGLDLLATPAQLHALPPVARHYWVQHGYRIDPALPWVLPFDQSAWWNHVDNPNTAIDPEPNPESPYLAARDIEAGEEITTDYRTYDYDAEARLAGHDPAELAELLLPQPKA